MYRGTGAFTRRLLGSSYLRKWVLLGTVIGVGAGLGAVAFIETLQWASHHLLGSLGGYHPPAPVGEGHSAARGTAHSWRIPLVVALGGAVSGLIVFRFAPEAEGHGTDSAIGSVHGDPTGIRARVPLVKIVASAITIGSGGSGGREGPAAQISAAFGSFVARRLRLSPPIRASLSPLASARESARSFGRRSVERSSVLRSSTAMTSRSRHSSHRSSPRSSRLPSSAPSKGTTRSSERSAAIASSTLFSFSTLP